MVLWRFILFGISQKLPKHILSITRGILLYILGIFLGSFWGTDLKAVNNYFGNVIGEFLDPLLESFWIVLGSVIGEFVDPLLGSYWGVVGEFLGRGFLGSLGGEVG